MMQYMNWRFGVILLSIGCLSRGSSEIERSLQYDFENELGSLTLMTLPPVAVPPGLSSQVAPPSQSMGTKSPTNLPTNIPTNPPSNIPTNPPTNLPTNPPTNIPTNPPTNLSTNPPINLSANSPTRPTLESSGLLSSSSPTLWPQNTCFFTNKQFTNNHCKDSIKTDGTKVERTLAMDTFLCSPNKRYRFGITKDNFICLCDGIKKIWCADVELANHRDSYLFFQRNGCLVAYSDRVLGQTKAWKTRSTKDVEKFSIQEDGKDKSIKQLQITNDGALSIFDVADASLTIWEPNLDDYKPYRPPTSAPTYSRSPTGQPTKSPAPSISFAPSSKATEKLLFTPGTLVHVKNLGLMLSEGLTATLIGRTNFRTRYANGKFSRLKVHDQPDAGGCFDQPDGGWIYLSNSEVAEGGGVGAFKFSSSGDLIDYKMVQTNSRMNCGGGITPWGTWFSGEEFPEGGMYEVDVKGGGARITQFGRGKFESATCDDRDMSKLSCFATLDKEDESLRRYQPSSEVLQEAIRNDDYSNVLHSGGGTMTYLFLNSILGTYSWIQNKNRADNNAKSLYPNLEGIDHHDGKLYLVSKVKRELFILDLDRNTYEVSSTKSGAFSGQPDQIKHLIGDDPNGSAYLYFLEDGGTSPGVFARNLANDRVFTILEKVEDQFDGDETTGLAFCDNFRRMIFAFQERGAIYEITRDDGLPFYGATANVKYHDTPKSRGDLKHSKANSVLRASSSSDSD